MKLPDQQQLPGEGTWDSLKFLALDDGRYKLHIVPARVGQGQPGPARSLAGLSLSRSGSSPHWPQARGTVTLIATAFIATCRGLAYRERWRSANGGEGTGEG